MVLGEDAPRSLLFVMVILYRVYADNPVMLLSDIVADMGG